MSCLFSQSANCFPKTKDCEANMAFSSSAESGNHPSGWRNLPETAGCRRSEHLPGRLHVSCGDDRGIRRALCCCRDGWFQNSLGSTSVARCFVPLFSLSDCERGNQASQPYLVPPGSQRGLLTTWCWCVALPRPWWNFLTQAKDGVYTLRVCKKTLL